LLTGLLPTLYTTVRINYLGNLPGDWGVNIASQLVWVNLILEVIYEALILPLFYLIGKTLEHRDETVNKIKSGLALTFGIYLICAIIIGLFAKQLVTAMAQNPDTIEATTTYIRFEMMAAILIGPVKFMMVVFILLNYRIHIYTLLTIQMILSIVLDSIMLSKLDFSFNLGVNGIAYSNIIVYATMLLYIMYVFCKNYEVDIGEFKARYDYGWITDWINVGKFSGLDSFIRNLFYLVFIVRMMNVISEQGTYWVANGFIWGWLLLPFYPLAELLKQDIAGRRVVDHKEKMYGYFGIATVIILLWIITIPLWSLFFEKVLNVPEPEAILDIVLILIPFYVLYVYNTLADSVFYGKGRTELLALQSIITNVAVYGSAFVLFQLEMFEPTLTGIALLFGTGIFVDSVVTYYLYFRCLKENNYQL
jgi:Na+-driven multidrug efflux pump